MKKAKLLLLALGVVLLGVGQTAFAASSWQTLDGITSTGGNALNSPIVVDSHDVPYVAYRDANNSGRLVVNKYVNGSWQKVGNEDFSILDNNYTSFNVSLAISNQDTLHMAYRDGDNGGKITVVSYDVSGDTWQVVGSAGFSSGGIAYPSLAIDSQGTPYVAYTESWTAVVKQYDSSSNSWIAPLSAEPVSTSSDFASYTSLALDGNNTPYVAFRDASLGNRANVKQYDSASQSWLSLATNGITQGSVTHTSLSIDSNNTIYLGYDAVGEFSSTSTVSRYNATDETWSMIGQQSLSGVTGSHTSLTLDSHDVPYMASSSTASKLSVQWYESASDTWQILGGSTATSSAAFLPSIVMDSNDTPYVTYANNVNNNTLSVKKYVDTSIVAINNAEDAEKITVRVPDTAAISCSSVAKEPALTTQDANYDYPVGLVDFCFTTSVADNQVTVTFVTDKKAADVVLRKYNPDTQKYATVTGATLTDVTYNGQAAVQAVYTITDNGELDLDAATGSIQDPVGLAVAVNTNSGGNTGGSTGSSTGATDSGTTTGSNDSLASTGTNIAVLAASSIALLSLGALTVVKLRRI